MSEDVLIGSDTFHCQGCGAALKYKPGTTFLHCDYCGSDTTIDAITVDEVEELDFEKYASEFENLNIGTSKVIGCRKCGAESAFDENLKSMECPYCSTPLIESDIHEERLIQPSYLLPFHVSDGDMHSCLSKWIKSLWFAPNKLKKRALYSYQLQGIYIPCWTYDAQTNTDYTGQRGKYYTTSVGSGKNRRTVVRTRWTYCNGHVSLFFDDVMVPASKLIPTHIVDRIGGWDTKNLVENDKRFLSGFLTEKYILNLTDGYDAAKKIMAAEIDSAIRRDIGGDRQQISSRKTRFSSIKFKLILLPVYMSSYTYRNKLYHFFVNGRTGKVTGDRPYSAIKIALATTFGLALIALIIWYLNNAQ
ncbi:MAG: hypothetical protein E6767_01480 [Dysgonomonas sp.]|nr:hypothetical protein [Dysgonomonas sp.]